MRIRSIRRSGAVLAVCLAVVACIAAGCERGAEQTEEEADQLISPAVSPDGKSVTGIEKKGDKKYVVRDGKRVSKGYAQILGSGMSPEGDRTWTLAQEGDKTTVLLDGQEVGTHDAASSPMFAPDGSLVYVARTGDKQAVLKDGKPVGGSFDRVGRPKISRSGEIAFPATEAGSAFVVCDGERVSGEYLAAEDVKWSGDSLGFSAVMPGRGEKGEPAAVVVKNGKPVGKGYMRIERWAYGPGDSVAYVAAVRNHEKVLVRDGRELGAPFQATNVTTPIFSPDGRHVACAAGLNRQWWIIKDGRPISDKITAQLLRDLLFSPDGSALACTVRRGGKWFVWKDGTEAGGRFDAIKNLRNSEDRTKLVATGVRGRMAVPIEVDW